MYPTHFYRLKMSSSSPKDYQDLIKSWYLNGELKSEGNYYNDETHGQWIEYTEEKGYVIQEGPWR